MTSRWLAMPLAVILSLAAPVRADDWHGRDHHEPDHRRHEDYRHEDYRHENYRHDEHRSRGEYWRDRDIYRFHHHDAELWRSGRWVHTHHDGRLGWWWITGGLWYFYPRPVYPYPDPFLPPVVQVLPTPGPVYYYCPPLGGYYPYVATCPSAWQQIPVR